MKSIPKISDLSDYPAIKKLASALHKLDANRHGAAIMIGAGFSRSAAHHVGGEKKMPLWNDFSKRLVKSLNPTEDLSFSDPLRVAEEYRAYFGQASLNDQIRFEIDDEAWRPGALYSSLLTLPWSEIMTTNWDTLLERAAKDIHNPYYSPVTKPSDLAWAQSPRIVKLHGTIGATDIFIATQEDYRSYPDKFAPFVNFARQVFIENELCLLGFSGDDPNFLQWAGWVRDHLADHARKIYLVGALNLSAARRKYLESINIAPVDLWDAVKHIDDRELIHRTANELFLAAMRDEGKSKAEPHQWRPKDLHALDVAQEDHSRIRQEPEYATGVIKRHLKLLQKDRESYPGWLVCPPSLRWLIRSQLHAIFLTPGNVAALDSVDRANLLYEIAWRHSVTFEYIAPWLNDEFFQFANPSQSCALSKRQQMELALILLKNSRWQEASDEAGNQSINERIQALIGILKNYASYLPDCNAELAYHQALVSLDKLNFAGIESVIENITGEDPVWKLRHAALLMELGRFDDATQQIREAYRELRERYRYNQNSIPILSRLAWCHWLLKAVSQFQTDKPLEPLPVTFKDWQCDPWVWIEDLQEKVRKRQEDYLKNQNPVEPLFDQGHYRNNSNNRSVNSDISEFLLLQGLSGFVGIPLHTGGTGININLLAGTAEKLILSGGIGIELWDYSLAIRAASSESSSSIKGIFTRIGLACASDKVVAKLVCHIRSAINYWISLRNKGTEEQRGHAISILRVLMEVFARLAVRVSYEEAAEIFKLAVSLGQQKDFQHFWLSDVIDHLLTYSLKSVPTSKQGCLLLDALAFPLRSELGRSDVHHWPNPIINFPNERQTYPGIEKRIGELITEVTPNGSNSSTAALLRLLPLIEKGFLKSSEVESLATGIWGETPNYEHLPNIKDLFPHAFLLLPVPDEQQVMALVQRHLYETSDDILIATEKELRSFPSQEIQRAITVYASMANAAVNEQTRLLPSAEQASILFERLMMWRPWKSGDSYFDFEAGQRGRLTESICNALSYAILPALSNEAKSAEQFNKLKAFYSEVDGAIAALPALVYFVSINDEIALDVERLVRKALQGRDSRDVAYAANALHRWSELSESKDLPQFKSLVSRLIIIIDSGRAVGLQQLLWMAGELFKKQQLSNEQIETLKEALINAFDISDYSNIDPNSREAINASSIREESVKLAKIICDQSLGNCNLEGMIKKSHLDALPEVRFAI